MRPRHERRGSPTMKRSPPLVSRGSVLVPATQLKEEALCLLWWQDSPCASYGRDCSSLLYHAQGMTKTLHWPACTRETPCFTRRWSCSQLRACR